MDEGMVPLRSLIPKCLVIYLKWRRIKKKKLMNFKLYYITIILIYIYIYLQIF